MNTMLDLRSMSDDEFTVLVTPTVPQTTMRVTVEESGKILLSSKVAAKLSNETQYASSFLPTISGVVHNGLSLHRFPRLS